MKPMDIKSSKNKSIFSFIVVKILLELVVILALFLRIFLGVLPARTMYLFLGVSILVLPISKFFVLTSLFNYLRERNITVLLPLFSLVLSFIFLSVFLVFVVIVEGSIISSLDHLIFFIVVSSMFEMIVSASMVPFLLERMKKRENVLNQILVSSIIVSVGFLTIIVIMMYSGLFLWFDQLVAIIVISSIFVISLIKSYSNIYTDLHIVNNLVLLEKSDEENISTEEFYKIFKNLEKIIANQYFSSVSLIKSIKEVNKGIESIKKELKDIYVIFEESRKVNLSLEENIRNDLTVLENIIDQINKISNDVVKYSEYLVDFPQVVRNIENTISESLPKVNTILSIITDLSSTLSLSIKNIKKSNDMLLSVYRSVPDITESLTYFNNTIKELRKTATRINAIRISFDVELRRINLDKQYKQKLEVISKKIDELFLRLQSTVNSVFIDEEKISIDNQIKTIIEKVNIIQSDIVNYNSKVNKLSTSLSTTLKVLEKGRNNIDKLLSSHQEITMLIKNILSLLEDIRRFFEDSVKKLNKMEETISKLATEYQDMENAVSEYRKSLLSFGIRVPKFIEDIYGV